MLIVSPHLDDAVFSCGALLSACPGCQVVTIFAGIPTDPRQSTDWDRRCGFENARQAVQARRREDEAALRSLGAYPQWLDFCDSQYGESPGTDEVAQALRRAIEEHASRIGPAPVLLPLGLFHSDHRLAHAAGALALAGLGTKHESPPPALLAYEDSPYRGMNGILQRRLAELGAADVVATPVDFSTGPGNRNGQRDHLEAKRAAVAVYASQLRAFGAGGYEDAWRPERFWSLQTRTDRHDA